VPCANNSSQNGAAWQIADDAATVGMDSKGAGMALEGADAVVRCTEAESEVSDHPHLACEYFAVGNLPFAFCKDSI